MFPITLDTRIIPIALVGNGAGALRRLRELEASGAKQLSVYAPEPTEELAAAAGRRLYRRLPEGIEIKQFRVVMAVDLPKEDEEMIARLCRRAGVLVNVEDVKPLCDFHFSSKVRRGDLLFTVSTGGKSPALSRYIRTWLEEQFSPEWTEHTEHIARKREEWKALGLSPNDIYVRTAQMIMQHGWLDKQKADYYEDEDEEEVA